MRVPQSRTTFVKEKLNAYVKNNSPEGMRDYLLTLSVSEFRAAGVVLADDVLPQVGDNSFWRYLMVVAGSNTKAYLGTFLKAAVKLYRTNKVTVSDDCLKSFADICTAIDRRKCMEALLPQAKVVDDAQALVRLFCDNRLDLAAPFLIKARTAVSYYVLFNMLKAAEADEIRRYAIILMRQGDSLSFRLVSILEKYFDLHNLPGSFSLRLESYELSRLDGGYDAFVKILNK